MTDALGVYTDFNTVKFKMGQAESCRSVVATEFPLTIEAGSIEIATLACSPSNIEELVTGFLYTNGFISAVDEIVSFALDTHSWKVRVNLLNEPDTSQILRRVYTSGCGKGVVFTNMVELIGRFPLSSKLQVHGAKIPELMQWLQRASELHTITGGVHTAAFSQGGKQPEGAMDDIGRHNAVDKVIGDALRRGMDMSCGMLLTTGRVSSEIVHKVRRGGIPIVVSQGAPTHQAVLQALAMNLTLVCFARGQNYTIFSHPERLVHENIV